jgi:TrmH family RNA methyltransferase
LVSKSQIKLITSLQQKKYRNKSGLFVAEGPKVIREFLSEGIELEAFFTTNHSEVKSANHYGVTEVELQKISNLTKANTSLALFKIPKIKEEVHSGLNVALDSVRDPGNLGTIIRLCDWFGVRQLICSEDTVDCYNPKVIQATMGSIARVDVSYVNLSAYLSTSKLPILGGRMDGENVYQVVLPKEAILVLGNEANGISEEISGKLTQALAIPQFGNGNETESLNVATAGAILLSELKRSTET